MNRFVAALACGVLLTAPVRSEELDFSLMSERLTSAEKEIADLKRQVEKLTAALESRNAAPGVAVTAPFDCTNGRCLIPAPASAAVYDTTPVTTVPTAAYSNYGSRVVYPAATVTPAVGAGPFGGTKGGFFRRATGCSTRG